MDVPAEGKRQFTLPLFLVLFRPSTTPMVLTHIGEGNLLYSIYRFKYWSSWVNHTDTSRNDVWPAIWASLSPLKLTQKSNYHTSLYSYMGVEVSRKKQEIRILVLTLSFPHLTILWQSHVPYGLQSLPFMNCRYCPNYLTNHQSFFQNPRTNHNRNQKPNFFFSRETQFSRHSVVIVATYEQFQGTKL